LNGLTAGHSGFAWLGQTADLVSYQIHSALRQIVCEFCLKFPLGLSAVSRSPSGYSSHANLMAISLSGLRSGG